MVVAFNVVENREFKFRKGVIRFSKDFFFLRNLFYLIIIFFTLAISLYSLYSQIVLETSLVPAFMVKYYE